MGLRDMLGRAGSAFCGSWCGKWGWGGGGGRRGEGAVGGGRVNLWVDGLVD